MSCWQKERGEGGEKRDGAEGQENERIDAFWLTVMRIAASDTAHVVTLDDTGRSREEDR